MSTLTNPAYSLRTRKTHADTCKFCNVLATSSCRMFGSVAVLDDAYPVAPGHLLIVPLRHVHNYFDMTWDEKRDLDLALSLLHKEIQSSDPTVTGFNIGTNVGAAAGQTVFHAHIHLIPRREGDTPRPRGGVRGVIPAKMAY